MKHYLLHITLFSLLMTPLTGCTAYSKWAHDLGEKMPTYDGTRCEGRWFCFGRGQAKRPDSYSGSPRRHMAPPPGMAPPPRGAPPGFAPPPGATPPSGYAPPPQRGMAPPSGMPPSFAPPPGATPPPGYAPPPQGGMASPSGMPPSFPPQQGIPPNVANGEIPPRPPTHNQYAPDQQLKPWEENPEWKKDLPQGPFDDMLRKLDW